MAAARWLAYSWSFIGRGGRLDRPEAKATLDHWDSIVDHASRITKYAQRGHTLTGTEAHTLPHTVLPCGGTVATIAYTLHFLPSIQ